MPTNVRSYILTLSPRYYSASMHGHVFVSYSRDDAAYVDRMVAHLNAAGLRVWTDLGIPAGADWARTIDRQIRASSVVVPVMSPQSRSSDWVANEIVLAQRLRKPVLPLLLAGEPFTELLSTQHEDVRDESLPPVDFLRRLGRLTRTRVVDPSAIVAAWPGYQSRHRPRWGRAFFVSAAVLVIALAWFGLSRVLGDRDPRVSAVAWSPNGTWIATFLHNDEDAWIWDAQTGERAQRLAGHGRAVSAMAWSPDSTRMATASYDHTARTWDAATGNPIHTLKTTDFVVDVAWSPDGAWVAMAQWHGRPKIWNAAAGKLLREVDGLCCAAEVVWSPDSSRIAADGGAGVAAVWEIAVDRPVYTFGTVVGALAWSPDGTRLAVSQGSTSTALTVEAATGRTIHTLAGHTDYVRRVAWSPDGSRLATTSDDNTTKV